MVMAMMVHPASQDICARRSRTVTGVDTGYTNKAPYSGARLAQRAVAAGGVL